MAARSKLATAWHHPEDREPPAHDRVVALSHQPASAKRRRETRKNSRWVRGEKSGVHAVPPGVGDLLTSAARVGASGRRRSSCPGRSHRGGNAQARHAAARAVWCPGCRQAPTVPV